MNMVFITKYINMQPERICVESYSLISLLVDCHHSVVCHDSWLLLNVLCFTLSLEAAYFFLNLPSKITSGKLPLPFGAKCAFCSVLAHFPQSADCTALAPADDPAAGSGHPSIWGSGAGNSANAIQMCARRRWASFPGTQVAGAGKLLYKHVLLQRVTSSAPCVSAKWDGIAWGDSWGWWPVLIFLVDL